MKRLPLLSSCLVLLSAPLVFAAPTPAASTIVDSGRVSRIDIQVENLAPGTSFDPKSVMDRLKTRAGDPFSESVFDHDLKVLSEHYDRIEPLISPQGGEVTITLKLWVRPIIRSIVWKGNVLIPEETVRKELEIKEKQTFHRVNFSQQFNKVKEYYIKKGYFESQLSYSVVEVPDTRQVDIVIDIIEGRPGIIDDIVLKGFTAEEESRVFNMIHTKKYNFFTSWITGHGTLHEEMLEQDRLMLVEFLHNEGYGDAQVSFEVANAASPDRVSVVITVERGPLFHFGEVTFRGNTLFPDQAIERVFLVHPEGVYSPQKLRNTSEAIRDLYGRKGYIDTQVQFEATPVADQPIYNAHFEIEEGGEYKIGLIHVMGNEQTQTEVILRESLLVPGEVFDSVRLKATQQRLQNIGYFKSVNVYAVKSEDTVDQGHRYRDVYIEVEETPTGHASLFFGLSSGDGVFGGLELTESNFNYKGIRKLPKQGFSALRGGGEYAHAKVQLGSKQRSFLTSWLTPYFRETLWRVGVELFLNQSKLQAKKYEIDSFGGSLFASYPLTPYWTAGTKYRAKHATIDVSHSAPRQERKLRRGTGNISAISGSMSFDSTDHIMKPHQGFRSGMEVEFSGLGGDFYFLKYSYTNSLYHHLWPKGTIKYRWDVKFIQPIWRTSGSEDIPVSERFFLGGENSLRGYKNFDYGPHYHNGDPKGGISTSLLSLEYNHEITSILDGFLFIDAGTLSQRKFRINQYQMSYGAGARVEVLRGTPITVWYGIPVKPKHHSQVQRFGFSMGGQF